MPADWNWLLKTARAEVTETIGNLPADLRPHAESVPVTYESWPDDALLEDGWEEDLLGMFVGDPIGVTESGTAPRQIILFGSRARGTAAAESDVDLLVVTDRPGSRRQQAVAIDLALADIRIAKDVVVVGVEELERDRDVVGTIAYPALREGVVLYDRAA